MENNSSETNIFIDKDITVASTLPAAFYISDLFFENGDYGNTLNVSGAVSFRESLSVGGRADLSENLSVGGNINSSGNLTVTNNLIVNGTIDSTNIFLSPRLTTTQRDSLTAISGMVIFNTTTNKHQGYNGASWFDFY